MAETAQLKMHIINYSKTREIYKEYKRSKCREDYRAAHADEIEKHEAAKAAFDVLGGKPIPKVAQLSEEYAKLLSEKKACYEKHNADRKAENWKGKSLFSFPLFLCLMPVNFWG